MKTIKPTNKPLATKSSGTKVLFVTFAIGLTLPLAAFAELSNDSMLGPGLRSRPAYDGSASQYTELVPVIRYFGQDWFARSTQGVLEGGARIELLPGLHAAAQVAYESGRQASKSDFLRNHNVTDLKTGLSVGMQLELDKKIGPMPITLLARVRQQTDSDRGAQVDLRLSTGLYHGGRVSFGAFTQATWANAKSTGFSYGITSPQSATTGLSAFDASGRWLFSGVGLLGSVDLSQNWIMVGSVESRRLLGDAVFSPLTERKSNHYASAGVAYRF